MKNTTYQHLDHSAFGPVYDSESKILILGSFPSVKSREAAFYYGHPQNRFWKVLAAVYDASVPETKEEKINFVLSRHIALWDVIDSCDIIGSSDASIRNVTVTDIASLLGKTKIRRIFVNGATGYRLFEKYQDRKLVEMTAQLPSTSPANAAWSLARLTENWKRIRKVQ